MGKLKCPCTNTISNTLSPSKRNGWLLKDRDLHDRMDDLCPIEHGSDVWECDRCGKIAIGRPDNKVKWYAPLDGEPGDLFT
jgi:hypothetical protein